MNRNNWPQEVDPILTTGLSQLWVPVGTPGFVGIQKRSRKEGMDARFGADGWRTGYYVRGEIVPKAVAILEYEESYRVYLRRQRELVDWLINIAGNVYDDNVTNVFDHDYDQPHTQMNHYQDISTRRVIAELVDDPAWPQVTATQEEEVELTDLNDGQVHRAPRAARLSGRSSRANSRAGQRRLSAQPGGRTYRSPALIITNHARTMVGI